MEITYRVPTDSTVYIGGVYEKNSDGTLRKYYVANGQTVAMRSVPSGGGAGTLFYMLQDHLSSTVKVLDSSFATYAEMKYYPFGTTRSATGSSPTDKLYTGQQEEPGDSALGLYNYGARFYSTTLGHFVSVDPLVPAAGDPQAWNSYAYVRNNPMRLIDPTGMRWDVDIEADTAVYNEHRAASDGCNTACQWIRAADAYRAASWIAAARAFQEAAAARAWAATVAVPTAASAAITQAAPNSLDDGCDGWFCSVRHAASGMGDAVVGGATNAVEKMGDTATAAGDAVSWCANSEACTSTVGTALIVGSPLCGAVAAAACLGAGIGILAAHDTQGCLSGSATSCAFAAADAATAVMGVRGAYGVTSIVAEDAAGRGAFGLAGSRAVRSLTAGNYYRSIQYALTSSAAINDTYRFAAATETTRAMAMVGWLDAVH
ncbi:MAG: RHS repeat-associated core domain-containing protein [Dehalococcoidia bacterium]|nr:MAG: RHS repeat-associated core domain-containing protein [Dehalococcoidia bacterium]